MSREKMISWVVECPLCGGKISGSGQPRKEGVTAKCPQCKSAEVIMVITATGNPAIVLVEVNYLIATRAASIKYQ